VDANIARVLARLANVRAPIDSPAGNRAIWSLATALLPDRGGGRLHTSALMELGALVCLPKKPQCLVCPVHSLCRAQEPETLPIKAPRKATIEITESAAWILGEEGLLLERQIGRRGGGLWSLPKMTQPPPTEPLFRTVYPFTHHRVTLQVYAATPPGALSAQQRWFALNRILEEAALLAGHRRAVVALLSSLGSPSGGGNRSAVSVPEKNLRLL
jgi:A/G-specific adenine glycosylase